MLDGRRTLMSAAEIANASQPQPSCRPRMETRGRAGERNVAVESYLRVAGSKMVPRRLGDGHVDGRRVKIDDFLSAASYDILAAWRGGAILKSEERR